VQWVKDLGLKLIANIGSNDLPNAGYLQANPNHTSTIIGWDLWPDEPDWGGNVPPAQWNVKYRNAVAVDPTRPMHSGFTKHMCDPQRNPMYSLADLQLYQTSCDSIYFDAYYYSDRYEPNHGAYMYGIADLGICRGCQTGHRYPDDHTGTA
jgi:hypothetical protein